MNEDQKVTQKLRTLTRREIKSRRDNPLNVTWDLDEKRHAKRREKVRRSVDPPIPGPDDYE